MKQARQAYQLPTIQPPSLEGLTVTLRTPTIEADDLMEALHQRLRAVCQRREREAGEPIAPGDEVLCDLITLVDGRTIPGGTRRGAEFEVREFLHLPGFIDQVIGMETFSAKTFELRLPEDNYPAPGLAGKTATYYLENRGAVEVGIPELDDADLLAKAGLGNSLEEAMEHLAQELDAEQGQALLIEASQAALSALAKRVEATIPPAAVDEELYQLWQKNDALVFQGKPFSNDFVEAARTDFVSDPNRRSEAEERIKIGLALGSLIESEGLEPSSQVLEELLSPISAQLSLTLEEAKECLKENRQELQLVGRLALYQEAVSFVIARTSFEFLTPSPHSANAD